MKLRQFLFPVLCALPLLLAAQNPSAPAEETVIDSDSLEMTALDDVNNFRFSGNVRAVGKGMVLTCDHLDVIARRQAGSKGAIGRMNSVQSIVAKGNVRMEQAGRVATAGRAEVTPDEGLVVLSENPKIVDSKATVEGWKIVYNSRDKTAQVLPTPEDQLLPGQKKARSRVTLSENAIPKRGLVKEYGKRAVVNEVDIDLRAGEIVGLLGPNGAGKTTSFYMIVGLIRATKGRVYLSGRDVTHVPMYLRARMGVGYLPQEPSVFRTLTVEENLMAVAETLKADKAERRAIVGHGLEELGLSKLARQKAYTLSGGERRRLEIARALVTRPRFLLMDEPFSGVDPISVADVQNIVRQLKDKGIGVLITDHNVRETLSIVDRAYLMYNGRVLCHGTSQQLVNDPESRKLYLGESFKM